MSFAPRTKTITILVTTPMDDNGPLLWIVCTFAMMLPVKKTVT